MAKGWKTVYTNINHRILLGKLWNIGIHDKRLLKIISLMLKVGYMEKQELYENEVGTSQGSILSPLLANVYLNDFDWYIGRKYYEPVQTLKRIDNDRRKLRWNGVIPKFNIRFADDWVILTSTENEAIRLKEELTDYFKYKLKLELSEEKTKITDLRKDGIKFLGYIIKAEKPRRTPNIWAVTQSLHTPTVSNSEASTMPRRHCPSPLKWASTSTSNH